MKKLCYLIIVYYTIITVGCNPNIGPFGNAIRNIEITEVSINYNDDTKISDYIEIEPRNATPTISLFNNNKVYYVFDDASDLYQKIDRIIARYIENNKEEKELKIELVAYSKTTPIIDNCIIKIKN